MHEKPIRSSTHGVINHHAPGLLDQLSSAIDQALNKQSSLFAYALIDSAFNEAGIASYQKMQRDGAMVSLYAATDLEGLTAVSPCLVQLPMDTAGRRQSLTYLLRLANGKPMLSVLAATCSLQSMKDHFAPFLQTETEGEQRFVLRFADTRILPALIQTFTPSQQSALLGPVTHWWTINRMGELHTLPLPTRESDDLISTSSFPMLTLSNSQFSALLDAAEADAFIEQLWLFAPEHCAAFKPGNLQLFIDEQLRHATKFGVEGTPDRIAYCIAAFNAEGPLHENVHAAALLKDRLWAPGNLADALAELPEECWLVPSSQH